MEHNLIGTLHLLEFCKRHHAGLVMLSTSRVYSLARLSALPMEVKDSSFSPRLAELREPGISREGLTEEFSTEPPLSLYGAAKLASELLIREYGVAFDLPVYINRCGVLAGAGQFGKAAGLYASLAAGHWNWRQLRKETLRLLAVRIFGPERFLKLRARQTRT